MTGNEKLANVLNLRTITGAGLNDCKLAVEYSCEHANGDIKMAIAYLKSKSFAVATRGLSFNERTKSFYEEELKYNE